MLRSLPFLLALVCLETQAQERRITPSSATVEDFCRDPMAAICGEKSEEENSRESKIQELRNRFAVAAWKKVEKALADAGTLEEWEEVLAAQKQDKGRKLSSTQRKIARVFFPALIDEAPEILGKSFEAAKVAFERTRISILTMLRKRLANVPQAERSRMLAQLDSKKVDFVNIVELMKASRDDDDALEGIAETCGRDGMDDNAYADPSDSPNGKNLIVICAGAFLADYVPGRFNDVSESAFYPQIWTLGHETGHLVDSGNHPIAYAKLAACVQTNYKTELKGEVGAYMSEISADYWGTEVLAEFLSTISDERYRMAVLQENLEGLCDSSDDGLEEDGGGGHPDGKFRLVNFVRRNPRLHQVLGCKEKQVGDSGATCTLRGQWRKRLF